MYPRNAASPERITVGAVVQISDGAVQLSGVTVNVTPQGGAAAAGGGTVAYSAAGTVLYTPTQAETNQSSFVVEASRAGCIPASVTVVTTASATPGTVQLAPVVHAGATVPTVGALTGHTAQTGDAFARLGAPAGASIAADVGSRLATSGYTAPDNTGIGQINARLPTDPADASDIAAAFAALAAAVPSTSAIASAVWSAGSRTLTAAAYSVADIVEGVWTRTVRLLSDPVPTAAQNATAARAELATELARLDVAVGTRSTYAGADTAGTTTLLGRVPGAVLLASSYTAPAAPAVVAGAVRTELATELARLDATVSSRSTYAGADTPGTATLLSHVTGPVLLAANYTAPLTAADSRSALGLATANMDAQFTAAQTILNRADTTMQLDGAVYRFTANALELAPTGTGAGGSGPSAEIVAAAVRVELAPELANMDAPVSGIPTAAGITQAGVRDAVGLGASDLDVQLAALGAFASSSNTGIGTLLTRASGPLLLAASYSAPPTAADVASAVRTNLATELARLDVAVSAAGMTAAGIRTALGLATANMDTQLAGARGILDKFDTMVQLDGAVYRFTLNALELAPAGEGGGGGGGASVGAFLSANGLDAYDADTVGGALYRLVEVPGAGPVDPVPAAPEELGVCRVYGFLVTPDNVPAAGVQLTFTLVAPGLTLTPRMLAGRTVRITTNRRGEIAGPDGNWIDLQRNDILDAQTPGAATTHYLVTCDAINVSGRQVVFNTGTADLAALLSV